MPDINVWRQVRLRHVTRRSPERQISHNCRQQKQGRGVYRMHGHESCSDAGGVLVWVEAGTTFCLHVNQNAFFWHKMKDQYAKTYAGGLVHPAKSYV